MSAYYARRIRIIDRYRNDPVRRENLLDLNEAALAFKNANDRLQAAKEVPFDESARLDLVPPTLVPSAQRERARTRIKTIAARMMQR